MPRSCTSTSTPVPSVRTCQVDIPIVGDCKDTLEQLNELLEDKPVRDWTELRRPWLDTVNEWSTSHPLTYTWDDKVIKPQFVVEKLYELTKGEAYITTEVGQNQMWAAQFYKFKHPRRLMTSGGLGVMGYGLPRGHGGADGQAGCHRHRYRRRRQHPDEHPGADHGGG